MDFKVLVTGADGQLGRSIKDESVNHPEINFVFVSKNDLDITDAKAVKGYFSTNAFDYCINCAAYTNVEQAEQTPDLAFKVNAEGVRNLALNCKKHDITLIHISTDYVFDGKKESPYTIHDRPNPINAYGKSKHLGEQYVQQLLEKYHIVRTSWLYSKIHGKNFYKTILEKAERGEILFVTDEQVGCPTDTVNLSKFIISLITTKNSNFGLSHFCDAEVMSWYEFAYQISDKSKHKIIARINHTKAKRPRNSVLV